MAQLAIIKPGYNSATKCDKFTGSNIAALQASFPSATFTDNGDGTWDVDGSTLHVTDWLINFGTVVSDATFFIARQLVTQSDKFVYDTQLTPYSNPARQVKDVSVPQLTLLNLKTTLTCTFDTAMPSASYEVIITFEGAANLVGSLNPPMVVSGTKTAAGFQFAVSAILAVAANVVNARVHVIQTP